MTLFLWEIFFLATVSMVLRKETMTEHKSYGQTVSDHDALGLELEDDVSEYTGAMSPDLMKDIQDRIAKALTQTLYQNKNFYVVLVTTLERMFGKPKWIVWVRLSCPTPVYSQHVFKYHYLSGSLEYLWTIPARARYYDILRYRDKYMQDKEWQEMTKFVVLMESGELLNWVKKENGEKIDAVIKINQES